MATLKAIPTWMAGHAKVIAIYDQPFWRNEGFSGDGISHRGPLVEIHDASPEPSTTGALFGFVGVPANMRRKLGPDLARLGIEQLTDMFGTDASEPNDVLVCDWANEPLTATVADEKGPDHHPAYGLPLPLTNMWDGTLLLGSTEIAPVHGGFLEGALEAAEEVFRTLNR